MSITEIQAIEQFVPHLRRFARALLDDTEQADGLVRDCLDEAVLRCHRHEPVGNLRVWLFSLLRQRCDRRCPVDDEKGAQEGGRQAGGVRPEAVAGFTVRDFENAFRQLSVEDQQILLLIGLEGMSHQETAEVLGLPLGTLMLRLWQIKKRLRGIELRTSGLGTPTVRPWSRSHILRHLGGAKPVEGRRHGATVIRLVRH